MLRVVRVHETVTRVSIRNGVTRAYDCLAIGSEHRQQGVLILGLGRVNQGTDGILRRRELLLRKRGSAQDYERGAKESATDKCHCSNTIS
jgi:hypothetical protein